jgi:uncharacterized protein YukE
MRSPDLDNPVSPFLGSNKLDLLPTILDHTIWDLLYKVDRLLEYAAKKGIQMAVDRPAILSHKMVDVVNSILLTDPMAIYGAANGLKRMYQTVAAQGFSLSSRYSQVKIDWEGRAFEAFDSYNTQVLDYLHGDNYYCLAQLLGLTSDALRQTADGVLNMRNALANALAKVAEKIFDKVQTAISEIEDDERNVIQELLGGAASAGVITGIQAATELVNHILGATTVFMAAFDAAVTLNTAQLHSAGQSLVDTWLGDNHGRFPNTRSSGDMPPDYGDWHKWHTHAE